MSYGLQIFNSNGEVIVDSTDFSLSGSEIQNTSSFGTFVNTSLVGPVSIAPEELLFQRLDVGQTAFFGLIDVVPGSTAVVISPNRDFFLTKPYNEIAEPSYGITVRNANGDPTFHSGGLLVAVKNTFNIAIPAGSASTLLPINVSVESSSNFFAVTSAVSQFIAPAFPSGTGVQFAPVLNRTSSTNVRVEAQVIGEGPLVPSPINFAVHFSFIEARVA